LYELKETDKANYVSHHLDAFWSNVEEGHPTSLKFTLLKPIRMQFFGTWIFMILGEICTLFIPQVLQSFILLLSGERRAGLLGNAWFLTCALTALQIFYVLTLSVSKVTDRSMNQYLESVLVGAIYKKSLRLSLESKSLFPPGKILNMIDTDVEQICESCQQMYLIVLIPFQFVLIFYFLFNLVGHAFWIGVGIVVLVSFASSFASPYISRFAGGMSMAGDGRVGLIREMLMGMRNIKLRTLEKQFSQRIAEKRTEQMGYLAKFWLTVATTRLLSSISPTIIHVAIFAVYSGLGNSMTADIIFPALLYFDMLNEPLTNVTELLSAWNEGKVSLQRVESFLLAKEGGSHSAVPPNPKNAIEFHNLTASWQTVSKPDLEYDSDEEKDEEDVTPFSLSHLNLEIPLGSKVAIIGKVGSGKSTFLSTILHDTTIDSGHICVRGSISYTSQQPWIMAGTIKDNITLGRAVDPFKLGKVLSLCELETDLKLFPNGSDTILGEGGINLSGGQQARLSLARALYQDSDVYLLDAPMASLDAKVAAKIFQNVVKEHLEKKTVLMVTHNREFVKDFELVVELDDGKLSHFSKTKDYDPPVEIFETQSIEIEHESDSDEYDSDVEDSSTEMLSKEDRETGYVGLMAYTLYLYAFGWLKFIFAALFWSLETGLGVFVNFWLVFWAADSQAGSKISYYIGIYVAISGAFIFFKILYPMFVYWGTYSSSIFLHEKAISSLLQAPMHFFEINPVGRIVNRMNADIRIVDRQVPDVMLYTTFNIRNLLVIIIIVCSSSFYLLAMFAGLLLISFWIFSYFSPSNVEMKRLVALRRSPMESYISETMTGMSTIKAYGLEELVIAKVELLIDQSQAPTYLLESLNMWMEYRLGLLSTTATAAVGIMAALSENTSPLYVATIGLALTYASDISGTIGALLYSLGGMDACMTAVQRVIRYAYHLPRENGGDIALTKEQWPDKGHVQFQNVSIAYPTEPEIQIIKSLTFDVLPGEKIGIVGRTGSGKSTLVSSLFRLMNLAEGRILIDGVGRNDLTRYFFIGIETTSKIYFHGSSNTNDFPWYNTLKFGSSWTIFRPRIVDCSRTL
jgi:ABC-type multidrug transport system fused ATPase/permease subunit